MNDNRNHAFPLTQSHEPASFSIPSGAKKVIETLEQAGFEAFLVGGCVRDMVLGRPPKDWDITTSAKPEEVKQLFRHTVDTGLKHGTVTVMIHREGFEVTTYRVDGEYGDGRHPDHVEFTSSLEEDLKRRDFTVNAMAYSPSVGIIDLFGGQDDLKKEVIRCVGEPRERFGEDALRILRALRFSAKLDFSIAPDTRLAIAELAGTLKKISRERIRTELDLLLTSDHPERLRDAWELGVTKEVLPEFDEMMATPQNNPHHFTNVGEHTLIVVGAIGSRRSSPSTFGICSSDVSNVPTDSGGAANVASGNSSAGISNSSSDGLSDGISLRILRWAALLHDVGKPVTRTTDAEGVDHFYDHARVGAEMAERILRDLKFDNQTIRLVTQLIAVHSDMPAENLKSVRKSVAKIGRDLYPYFLALKAADAAGKAAPYAEKGLAYVSALRALFEQVVAANACLTIKDLAVSGRDLMETGIPAGPGLGQTLNRLLDYVIENPEANERESLLSLVRNKSI
ncbi:MAG: CCA tRNA nucleotidyltransferase [Lachnospiraceae bacterium]|nr:CCA tRNA nucleotidyltransferase [Lachnospiraceae bacterium]